jgi:hypothetical protein
VVGSSGHRKTLDRVGRRLAPDAAGRQWVMQNAKLPWLQQLAVDMDAQSDWDWRAMFNTDLNDPFAIAY